MSNEERLRIFEELSKDFSLVRVIGKRPKEKGWTRFCHLRRDFAAIGFLAGDNAGIACGPASGVLGLDIDNIELFERFCHQNGWKIPETRTHMSGGDGIHHFFRYPIDGNRYKNHTFKNFGFDIRGDGGALVAPGSIHPTTGKLYRVSADIPLAPAPEWLLDLCREEIGENSPTERLGKRTIDIQTLAIPEQIRVLIKTKFPRGKRSEPLMTAINSLIRAQLSNNHIVKIILSNPIGEKALEKGKHAEKWVRSQIARAHEFVSRGKTNLNLTHFKSEEILDALANSERGDSKLLIQVYEGKFCLDHKLADWFKWDCHFWEKDGRREVLAAVDAVVDLYEMEAKRQEQKRLDAIKAADEGKRKEAEDLRKKLQDRKRRLQKTNRRRSVLILASSGQGSLGILGDEWDSNPYLLGCKNGVINLKDGSFRNGLPSDYIKTVAPTDWVDLNAPSPVWEQFVNSIFDGKQELIEYVQRLLGYSIIGEVREHVLPILWGKGRNGKSTLVEALRSVLGPLVGSIPSETLLDQKYTSSGSAHTADLMQLRGRRIICASETSEGRKFNLGKVKGLVGGDTLLARPPHGKDFIEISPSYTLFLLTNNKPEASADDFAFWQRVHLIPFGLSFVNSPTGPQERQSDQDLPAKLQAEAAGILAWLVRGCLEWQAKGLKRPAIVERATEDYRVEEDTIGQFLEECCIKEPAARIKSTELYNVYKRWCEQTGHTVVSQTNFGRKIADRFQRHRSDGVQYLGLGLKPDPCPIFESLNLEAEACDRAEPLTH